ncbi:hypothetical protein D1872_310220 [compost metagenome]
MFWTTIGNFYDLIKEAMQIAFAGGRGAHGRKTNAARSSDARRNISHFWGDRRLGAPETVSSNL